MLTLIVFTFILAIVLATTGMLVAHLVDHIRDQ